MPRSHRLLLAMATAVAVLAGLLSTGARTASFPLDRAMPAPAAAAAIGLNGRLPASTGTPAAPVEPAASATERVDCRVLKCIALTMDDGPAKGTAGVLDLLARKHVHATFFLIGLNVVKYPGLVRRMIAEGHVVGNHSWSHPQFWRLTPAAIRSQLTRTNRAIAAAGGGKPVLLRAPYGEVGGAVNSQARSLGLALVQWNVDPEDWKYRNTSVVVSRVLRGAKRNAIILTHDIRPTTRAAYGRIIDGLQARGYTLVTVPQLLGSARPGTVYLHG